MTATASELSVDLGEMNVYLIIRVGLGQAVRAVMASEADVDLK